MKIFHKISLNLAVLVGGVYLVSAQAADTVFQRTDKVDSIVLSNIEDTNTEQIPLAAFSTPSVPVVASVKANPPEVATRKRSLPERGVTANFGESKKVSDETEEAINANSEDGRNEVGIPDTKLSEFADKKREQVSSVEASAVSSSGNAANAYGGGSIMGSMSQVQVPSADAATSNTSGVGAGVSSTASTGTGSVQPTVTARPDTLGTIPASAPVVTSDSSLAASLQQYRDLMLQQAAANINSNPAISRRYLMVDRNTYVSNIKN